MALPESSADCQSAPKDLDLDSICSSLLEEGFIPTPWEADPGEVHPDNAHSRDEIVCVLAGKLELTLNGTPHPLAAGDRILIPAGTNHDLKVLGDAPVQYVSAIRKGQPSELECKRI